MDEGIRFSPGGVFRVVEGRREWIEPTAKTLRYLAMDSAAETENHGPGESPGREEAVRRTVEKQELKRLQAAERLAAKGTKRAR